MSLARNRQHTFLDRDPAAVARAAVKAALSTLEAAAASAFVLNEDGSSLRGALLGWDWTRTSFETPLLDWPNVDRAVRANSTCLLDAGRAELGEKGWFERGGIAATVCAPLEARGRVVGVMFFDFASPKAPGTDFATVRNVAEACAAALASVSGLAAA